MAFDFTIQDNRFWLVDEYNQLFEINEKGEILSQHDVPDEIFSCMINHVNINDAGNVVLQVDGNLSYELKEDAFTKVESEIQIEESEEELSIIFGETQWDFNKENRYIGFLGTDDQSQIEQMRLEYETTHPVSYVNSRASSTYISLKRDAVKSRAAAMANYTFTVTAAHKTVRTGAALPAYIANANIGDMCVLRMDCLKNIRRQHC